MNEHQQATARQCLAAAEDDSLPFPQIVDALIAAGFESYLVDYRRNLATYYLPDGDAIALDMHDDATPVAAAFDVDAVQAAIRDAQRLVPGYSYRGFCRTVRAAGCAGYLVSFSGARALYFGRTGDTHVELFPQ